MDHFSILNDLLCIDTISLSVKYKSLYVLLQFISFNSCALQQSVSKQTCIIIFRSAALIIFTGLCFIRFPDKGLADDMQGVGPIEIDRTEVTIGEFRKFVEATNFVTKAEKDGGDLIYELGGCNWRSP